MKNNLNLTSNDKTFVNNSTKASDKASETVEATKIKNSETYKIPEGKKIHKVVVDRQACIGAVTCVIVAPEAFEMDSEGIAIVKPGAENLSDDMLLMAAQCCPVQAIYLYDKEGKQIFP